MNSLSSVIELSERDTLVQIDRIVQERHKSNCQLFRTTNSGLAILCGFFTSTFWKFDQDLTTLHTVFDCGLPVGRLCPFSKVGYITMISFEKTRRAYDWNDLSYIYLSFPPANQCVKKTIAKLYVSHVFKLSRSRNKSFGKYITFHYKPKTSYNKSVAAVCRPYRLFTG